MSFRCYGELKEQVHPPALLLHIFEESLVKTHALVASFSQPAQAAQAVQALCRSEFRAGDIYVKNTPRGRSPEATKRLQVLLRAPRSLIVFYATAGGLIGFGESIFFINRVGFIQDFLMNHGLLIIASGALLGVMLATAFGALLHSDDACYESRELEPCRGDIQVCVEADSQSQVLRGTMIFEYYNANQVTVTTNAAFAAKMEVRQV